MPEIEEGPLYDLYKTEESNTIKRKNCANISILNVLYFELMDYTFYVTKLI